MSEVNYWSRMRRRRLSRRALLGASARAGVGAAGLALVGCGDDDSEDAVSRQPDMPDMPDMPDAPDTPDDPEPRGGGDEPMDPAPAAGGFTAGGVLRVAGPIDTWDYMDPHRGVFGPTQFNMSLYMNYLIRWANKEQGVLEGDIGSLPETPDEETYVFGIDNGATYWAQFPTEDGRAVTAEDIRFNIQRQIDGLDADGNEDGTFLNATQYRKTASMEVVDQQTLSLKTDGPDATYLTSVHAGPFAWITSPEAIETFGNRWRDETTNVELVSGTGPFIPRAFDPDTLLAMDRNPNYWKSDANGPLPHLAGYEASRIVDATAVEAAYRANQIDFGYFPLSKVQVEGIANDFPDHPANQTAFGFTIVTGWFNWSTNWAGEDGQGNPWLDRRVAYAFNAAVDRFLMIDAVYLGDARLSLNGAAPWFNQFWKVPDDEVGTVPGWRADRDADIQFANQMLDAAGFDRGREIVMLLPDVWEGSYPGIAETQRAMYQDAIGANVTFDVQPYTVILARLQDGTYPGSPPIWQNPPADLDPTSAYLQALIPGGSTNFYSYDYQPVADLVNQMSVTLDPEERRELALQVQRIGAGIAGEEHGLDGMFSAHGVMNGIQRNIAWPYMNLAPDWHQFAHNAHLFDTTWLDTNHPDYPA